MKKVFIFLLICITVLTLYYFNKGYNGKYVRWGDSVETVNIKVLERNDIPYKIKNNKVYIPEDAISKATFCCT
ncbi:hypothetical protein PDQ79_23480 [Bacillus cereus]|uniref:Uncharacterized protein n=1 Tax=Bacillus fungorum TaxID=2039284 RepID=A0A2G6Q7G9_9BACI|nr:hypothetical protein [Bacillus fungorum]MDA2637463.1 hypothetical protein [Bacillus cereus]PIE92763.1 hypothetical protein CO726_24665 [Bacillus fungorum]